jgi:hypothetical protein
MERGGHTRPRVFRPAPSPVGHPLALRTFRFEGSGPAAVAGGAPATAPEAGALPIANESFRSVVREAES